MPCPLAEAIQAQSIWTSKAQYADAERKFHTKVSLAKDCTNHLSSLIQMTVSVCLCFQWNLSKFILTCSEIILVLDS